MRKPSENDIERFWGKVSVGRLEDCWPFLGYCRPRRIGGHGAFKYQRKTIGAHRFALASTGVDIKGLVVRHKCDLAACCNPSHLHVGDHWDNAQDRVDRGRTAKGTLNGRAVLTEAIVIKMRQDLRPHYLYAKRYGVDVTTISLARRGVTWSHLNEEHPPITKTTG